MAINGQTVKNWREDISKIAQGGGKPLALLIDRNGSELTITATPEYLAAEKRYRLGIYSSVGKERDSFLTATSEAGQAIWVLTRESGKSLVALPTKVPDLFRQTFLGEERDPEGLVGVVGAARVSGEAVGSERLNTNERLTTFILLVASLNIFVGIFNLLPILPLDGGHMAVAIADEFRSLFARLRGRPRPAPINVNVLTPVTAVIVVLLGILTVILLLADIFNPISLNL